MRAQVARDDVAQSTDHRRQGDIDPLRIAGRSLQELLRAPLELTEHTGPCLLDFGPGPERLDEQKTPSLRVAAQSR